MTKSHVLTYASNHILLAVKWIQKKQGCMRNYDWYNRSATLETYK